MIELLAWLGTSLIIIGGLPQAIQCWRQGHSKGLNPQMLWSWFTGSVISMPFLYQVPNGPNFAFHVGNLLLTGVMLWYMYFPRNKNGTQ